MLTLAHYVMLSSSIFQSAGFITSVNQIVFVYLCERSHSVPSHLVLVPLWPLFDPESLELRLSL